MGNLSAIELGNQITKPYLKKQLKKKVFTKRPELRNFITDKIIIKCLIYISGYIKCLHYHKVQPINSPELMELLTEECLDWMVEYVEKGGK